ncbi:MAG TPA: helix-turn-helix domain-containing protein [Solirubrobacterales bacterium]|nr:helix-turn-helix domain-containing protein [Solirubrobacterales bacterium]
MTTTRSDANDLFIALAHPLRRRVLREALAGGGEISPRELASNLNQPLSRLSYHVRVLSACGALELVRTEQVRGSTQHFYRPVLDAPWAKLALEAHEGSPGDGKA